MLWTSGNEPCTLLKGETHEQTEMNKTFTVHFAAQLLEVA
jgi:hypothetical protein